MKNTKEFLNEVKEFSDFIAKRAEELIVAKGCQYDIVLSGIEFEETAVYVRFSENTTYEFPNNEGTYLNIQQLEMNDADWTKYIEGFKLETTQKQEAHKKEVENDKIEGKKKEFERLKKELGY